MQNGSHNIIVIDYRKMNTLKTPVNWNSAWLEKFEITTKIEVCYHLDSEQSY